MRVAALLSFWDEEPVWLAATVASCRRFCDHVFAVDGAYASFPTARASSGTPSHNAITAAAESCGLGLTLHVPSQPWRGNEVAKRTAAFALAAGVLAEDDWLFVIDADERVIEAPPTVRDDLERAVDDVGTVRLRENGWDSTARRLFRLSEGLRVVGNHHTYLVGHGADERVLWGEGEVPAFDLPQLVLRHLHSERRPERVQTAQVYAQRRDRYGLEAGKVATA